MPLILTEEERAERDRLNREHHAIIQLRRIGKGYLVRLYPPNSLYSGYLSPRALEWLKLAGNTVISAPGGYVLNPEGQQHVGVL